MIWTTLAVAASVSVRSLPSDFARDARIARVFALALDSIILGVISLVVNNVFGVTDNPLGPYVLIGPSAGTTTVAWPWTILLGYVYFTLPESLFGGSPGKLAARLRVVRLDARPLTVGAVIVRNLLKPIDYLPLFYLLGGLSVLLTRGSQRIGDLAAGTTVVYRHRALEPGATRSSGRNARLVWGTALALAVLSMAGFDYFGRPPLAVEGLFNEHRLLMPDAISYTLGSPDWGAGTVTYPIQLRTRHAACTGTISLAWFAGAWSEDHAYWTCAS